MSPEEFFRATGRLRRDVEAAIEQLLSLLDEIDGDPDCEPAGDEEPDLGSVEAGKRLGDQTEWAAGSDTEPNLGAPEHHPDADVYAYSDSPTRDPHGSQTLWGRNGNRDDRELSDDIEEDDSHDGREPDVDDEPSLGSFDRLADQAHAWRQTQGERTWFLHTNSDAESTAPF